MSVVKRRDADRLVEDAVVLDLADLKRQADAILAAGRAQADAILAEARAKADHLAAGADQRGFDEGWARGEREGRAEGERLGREAAEAETAAALAELRARWTAALDAFERDRRHLVEQAREDVLRLALAIGSRIALRLPEVDPEVVVDQVAEAIALVGRSTRLQIRIHPADREGIARSLPDLLSRLGASDDAEVVEDAAVDRGGVIVRTPDGGVDARIATQVARIAEALLPAPAPPRADRGPDPEAGPAADPEAVGETNPAAAASATDADGPAVGGDGIEGASAADDPGTDPA